MPEENLLAAEMLEAGAAAYASAATEALLGSPSSASETQQITGGRTLWKAHFTQRVQELAASVRADEPALFAARVRWLQRAYSAQQVRPIDQQSALAALKKALVQELPAPLHEAVVAVIEYAATRLEPNAAPETCELAPTDRSGRLALEYLAACLEGFPTRAVGLITAAADAGFELPELYTAVLLPAQKEIGRMWHAGEATIAEERIVSDTTRRSMSILSHRAAEPAADARTMLAAPVAGNTHDLALRAATDLFAVAGWRSLCLGADVPVGEIAKAVSLFDVDLVALAATLTTQLKQMQRSIAAIREVSRPTVKILVGGQLFDDAPGLWRWTGADAYAGTVAEVVGCGERLVAPRS
jgi:methanogenic corrinoid protein MtbC1